MSSAWATLLGFIILSATIAYLGRYDVGNAGGGFSSVTDRWAGTVTLCLNSPGPTFCFSVFPQRPRLPTADVFADEFLGPAPSSPTKP